MKNNSIYVAFKRFWQHILTRLFPIEKVLATETILQDSDFGEGNVEPGIVYYGRVELTRGENSAYTSYTKYVLPGERYRISTQIGNLTAHAAVYFYDDNNNFAGELLRYDEENPQSNKIENYEFTIPTGFKFIRMSPIVSSSAEVPFQLVQLSTKYQNIPAAVDRVNYSINNEITPSIEQIQENLAIAENSIPTVKVKTENRDDNLLANADWHSNQSTVTLTNKNDSLIATNSASYGGFLDQITESKIIPKIGYYTIDANGNITSETLQDIDLESAKLLTDAQYGSECDIKGLNQTFIDFQNNQIAGIELELIEPLRLGALEMACRAELSKQATDGAPSKFDIEVKNTDGAWEKVYSFTATSDNTFYYGGTKKFIFNKIVYGQYVRVLIYDCIGDVCPALLEVSLFEEKISGPILEKINPVGISLLNGNNADAQYAIENIINENKHLPYEVYFSGGLMQYEINLVSQGDQPIIINQMRISAWNGVRTPKKIIVEGKLYNENWVNMFGAAATDKTGYQSEIIYQADQITDTYRLNFDKDYEITAIRLSISSPVSSANGNNVISLNNIEFYRSLRNNFRGFKNSIDIITRFETPPPSHLLYFESKIACLNYNQLCPPKLMLSTARGPQQLLGCPNNFIYNDYYCLINGADVEHFIQIAARYDDNAQMTCKFSDIELIDLTDIYGAGNEPSAEQFYELRKNLRLVVQNATSFNSYSLAMPDLTQFKFVHSKDLNDAWNNGLYYVDNTYLNTPDTYCQFITVQSVSDGYVKQTAYLANNCVATRSGNKTYSTWQEWEWYNPPMIKGIEYRLTKRHKGQPVYAIIMNLAALQTNTTVNLPIDGEVDEHIIFNITAKNSNGAYYQLTSASVASPSAMIVAQNNRITIQTNQNFDSYTGTLYCEYTKK